MSFALDKVDEDGHGTHVAGSIAGSTDTNADINKFQVCYILTLLLLVIVIIRMIMPIILRL